MGVIGKAAIVAAGAAGGGLAFYAASRRPRRAGLSGRTALITGGSRGLGFALACEFARRGCRVAICSRDRAELSAAARDPRMSAGAGVLAIECDVTDRASVERMAATVVERFGTVDFLVNNAGEMRVGPLESMTVEDFRDALGVMFWGMVYPTLALLPHMREQTTGTIVNITSIGGKVAVPHLLPYACAKFAAIGFSEGLRAELQGTGVRVTTVVPGLMRTGSYLNAAFKGQAEREAAWFSVAATLPGITIGANRAARQIVDAAVRGDAEKILTVPAKALALGHGIFPGFTADVLGWISRYFLPSGAGTEMVAGRNTRVMNAPLMSALTLLGRRAARSLRQTEEQPVEAAG